MRTETEERQSDRPTAPQVLELIRLTSTSLPADVEQRLREAAAEETPGSPARAALETILKNVELSRAKATPICQDTGTPIFLVHFPEGLSTREIAAQIRSALAEATRRAYMRPNAVNAVSDRNTGDNLGGDDFPYLTSRKRMPINR
jgi:fumarate hydratase class I